MTWRASSLVTALALFLQPTGAAPQDHLITSLPGAEDIWDELPNMYSGYLDLPNTEKHVFYLYVESENDPENDPVALWTNGVSPQLNGFRRLHTLSLLSGARLLRVHRFDDRTRTISANRRRHASAQSCWLAKGLFIAKARPRVT